MTLKQRRRIKSFLDSGYYGKMSFKVYLALRNVGFASLLLFLTPIVEYKCQTISAFDEIVCIDKDKNIKARFSINSDTQEEKDRAEYMKANREK